MDVTARTPSLTETTGHNGNESTSNSTSVYFTTGTTLDNKTGNETAGAGLTHSEKSLTIMFSVVLGVIVLLVFGQIVYRVTRSKQRRVQYSHHPLFNENTGEQFMVQDDTLVISGGLYNGPQIYNSTVTAINDDQQTFVYTPTQFRLELLNEDPGTEQTCKAFTFKTFNNIEQEPQ
ncbi:sialomucin core protein 24-like [Trichomycterus rosablanca]|uniref:sialomucin core protein 24-like n=1 Tax=Trichomycterus rosablanca TaxID=2290929 RepID=UPI002F356BC6